MADYLAGRGSERTVQRTRRGHVELPYPRRTVALVGLDGEWTGAMCDMFRAAGATVVVLAPRELTPGRGGRFYPSASFTLASMEAHLQARGEHIDVIITTKRDALAVGNGGDGAPAQRGLGPDVPVIYVGDSTPDDPGAGEVCIAGSDAAQGARLALMLAHPASTVTAQRIKL